MAVVTLRPNATTAAGSWTKNTAPAFADHLDDDSDLTFVSSSTNTDTFTVGFDTFSFVGEITSVSVRVRAKINSGTESLSVVQRVGGVDSAADSHALGYSFATYTGAARTLSPAAAAWTQADIDGLEVKVTRSASVLHTTDVAEIFVDVVYVPNVAPNAPTITFPTAGGTINKDVTNRFDHDFSDPDLGDTQSAYEYEYRLAGGGAATSTGQLSSPNTFHDFAAGTFTADNWETRARTWDALGVVGSWSGWRAFTAIAAPTGPSITSPSSGSTISQNTATVTWSVPAQGSYQIRKVADSAGSPDTGTVYYDSGEVVAAATRSVDLSFPTNNRFEHIQVRSKVSGIWTSWDSVRVEVDYTPPATPTITVQEDEPTGAISVQATHPTSGVGEPSVTSVDVYRRHHLFTDGAFAGYDPDEGGEDGIRIAAGLAALAVFEDWAVRSVNARTGRYSYAVVAHGDNGTSSPSAWSEDGSGVVEPEIYGGAYS